MKKKNLYKVLNRDMKSPYQNFSYNSGEIYQCENFDTCVKKDCSAGFYATDIDGLPYCYDISKRVFRAKVWGREVEIDPFKRRYEYIRIGEEVSQKELFERAKKWEDSLGYRLSEVISPIDPRSISIPMITENHIILLHKWASVRASVGDSVGASVRASMWASVWDYAWASMWAYGGSLFFNINKWKYITHEKGEYPFQPAVDLWKQGLVPSFDGKLWRLHGGKDMGILYQTVV